MGVFEGLQIALDLSYDLKIAKKLEVKNKILENGGIVSFIVTRKCHLLIINDPEKSTSSLKCRMAKKYGLPILKLDYIWDSLQASSLLPHDSYVVGGKSKILDFKSGKISASVQGEKNKKFNSQSFNPRTVKVRTATDSHQPWQYEERYEVAKYAVFKGHNSNLKCQTMAIIELHTPPAQLPVLKSSEVVDKCQMETRFNYRVMFHTGATSDLEAGKLCRTEIRYVATADQALAVFAMLHEDTERRRDMIKWTGPVRAMGSIKFQKLMAEMVDVHCGCSEAVKELVEQVWAEAMTEVTMLLGDIRAIKIEQIEKAEAILVKVRDAIKLSSSDAIIDDLTKEFYSTLPHRNETSVVDIIERKKWLVKKQDMCQLIRDMISASEMTDYETRACIEAKYAALRCKITHLTGRQRDEIEDLVKSSIKGPSQDLRILNVYEVWRQAEDLDFCHDLDGKQLLFHSSKVENFLGILSRGLLLPKVIVDDFGGKRSDAGNLGSGIYFASSASTSVKYSSPSKIKGSRLLLINEVALGHSKDYTCHDTTLVAPPSGYNSTHGVNRKREKSSEFEHDEFVVYAVNQQRLRYLVEFTIIGDVVKPLEIINKTDNKISHEAFETATTDDVMGLDDPLSKIKPGLIISTGDGEVKLCGVHIRARLIDLAGQVVVLQEYCNNSQKAIEAKYVFPLEDTATVCGFEAFINGKHIIGEVKEKETAHKEYKKAISEGHGAYLMDQDVETPDVFTVSVGNLPPGATVLIKITYVAELQVEGEHISFSLPAAVAPWKETVALKQSTQEELSSYKMTLSNTTVQVAVEMPFEIKNLHCPTHKIKMKQTACKAYVEMMNHQTFGSGFQLLISLSEIHVPRMWVEKHPVDTDHRACMLTFYPEFESEEVTNGEIIIILDTSNSMKGRALLEAKKVALLILQNVPLAWHFNVVRFGSDYEELFAAPKINKEENIQLAISFIQNSAANKGNTDVLKPLRSLFLLPHSDGQRNVFLISDGHINSDELVLRCANQNSMHTRVFSFGISATCNRYFLKALSRVSGGSFEFFDIKTKSNWELKVKGQMSKARQPGLTSVAVEWQQYDDNVPMPVQAPRQITALFSGSRQVVYGFVANCTMATLKATVDGQEVSTVVSTSDLSVTEGLLVHRLTARAVIRDWEDGVLSSDRTQHEMAKMDLKNYIIDLSKKYSIVTQFTSFIAVENREENEKDLPKSGPSLEELVKQESVDLLSYMDWTKLPEDDNITVMSMINKLSQAVRQQELSNKDIYELEVIEEKYRKLRQQTGPLNEDVLNAALVLADVYCQTGEIDKGVNTAEIAYKEATSQAFRMVEDPGYSKLAEILLDLRNKTQSMKDDKYVCRNPIPFPKDSIGKIFIKTLTGSLLTVPCIDALTFGCLKQVIWEKEGTPVNQQRSIYNGRQLDDSVLLRDVNIGYGDTVYLVQRLRGGGDSHGINTDDSGVSHNDASQTFKAGDVAPGGFSLDRGGGGLSEVGVLKDIDDLTGNLDWSVDYDDDFDDVNKVLNSDSDAVYGKAGEEEEVEDYEEMGFGLFDGDSVSDADLANSATAAFEMDEEDDDGDMGFALFDGDCISAVEGNRKKEVFLDSLLSTGCYGDTSSETFEQPGTAFSSLQTLQATELPQLFYSPTSPSYCINTVSQAVASPATSTGEQLIDRSERSQQSLATFGKSASGTSFESSRQDLARKAMESPVYSPTSPSHSSNSLSETTVPPETNTLEQTERSGRLQQSSAHFGKSVSGTLFESPMESLAMKATESPQPMYIPISASYISRRDSWCASPSSADTLHSMEQSEILHSTAFSKSSSQVSLESPKQSRAYAMSLAFDQSFSSEGCWDNKYDSPISVLRSSSVCLEEMDTESTEHVKALLASQDRDSDSSADFPEALGKSDFAFSGYDPQSIPAHHRILSESDVTQFFAEEEALNCIDPLAFRENNSEDKKKISKKSAVICDAGTWNAISQSCVPLARTSEDEGSDDDLSTMCAVAELHKSFRKKVSKTSAIISDAETWDAFSQSSESSTRVLDDERAVEDLKIWHHLGCLMDDSFKEKVSKKSAMTTDVETLDANTQSREPSDRMQVKPLQVTFGVNCVRTHTNRLQLEDLDELLEYQTEVGSWELKSELDDLLGIDSNQCLNILLSSGLSSLGKCAAEDIKQLVATLLVLYSVMELLLPEYFPIGGSSVQEFPASGICFEQILSDSLLFSGCWGSFPQTLKAIQTAFMFCVMMEQKYPVVYSTLELGTSWLNVTTAFMQLDVE